MLRLGRAGRALAAEREPYRYYSIGQAVELAAMGEPDRAFAHLGPHQAAARQCLRQRLLSALMWRRILPAAMIATHRVDHPAMVLPLPGPWRRTMAAQGVRVAWLRSALAWRWQVVTMAAHAIASAIKLGWISLSGRGFVAPSVPYAVLVSLPGNAAALDDHHGHDFLAWFRRSPLRDSAVKTVFVQVTQGAHAGQAADGSRHVAVPLPALSGWAAHLGYAFDVVLLGLKAFFGLMPFGPWWNAVLVDQEALLRYVRRLPPTAWARDYVFNNSASLLRPLWTHVAEAAGARVSMVFYSINNEVFHKPGTTYLPLMPGHASSSWDRFGVFDAVQAAFVRRTRPRAEIIELGCVDLIDHPAELPELPERFVAVYDVPVFRSLSLSGMGMVFPYYCEDTAMAFLLGAAEALERAGLVMVLKTKRDLGTKGVRRLRRLVTQLAARPNVMVVHHDFAASRLSARATGVISMPFTSTAVGARVLGRPSVYFDPRNWLDECGNSLSHGIPVLTSMDKLNEWCLSLP